MTKLIAFDRIGQVYYYIAENLGYLREEGIELELVTGMPSYCAGKVAATELHSLDSFAQADSSVAIQLRTEGLPLMATGAVLANVVGVASLDQKGITHPKDLAGKRIGVAQGSGEATLLPILLDLHGIDVKDTVISHVGPSRGRDIEQGPQALVNGSLDAFGGYLTGTLQDALYLAGEVGRGVNILKLSDYGIEAYEMCFLFHEDMLERRPELVRSVLRAIFRAVAWMSDNRDDATALLADRHASVAPQLARNIVNAMSRWSLRPEVRDNGLGWMNGEVWLGLRQLMVDKGVILEGEFRPFWTNEFLTPGLLPRAAAE